MPMVSRKRSRLLIAVILTGALVASGSPGSRVWAGEPDSTPTSQPDQVGQLSTWALLHGLLMSGALLPPLP